VWFFTLEETGNVKEQDEMGEAHIRLPFPLYMYTYQPLGWCEPFCEECNREVVVIKLKEKMHSTQIMDEYN
jgi:hypothetical protein